MRYEPQRNAHQQSPFDVCVVDFSLLMSDTPHLRRVKRTAGMALEERRTLDSNERSVEGCRLSDDRHQSQTIGTSPRRSAPFSDHPRYMKFGVCRSDKAWDCSMVKPAWPRRLMRLECIVSKSS